MDAKYSRIACAFSVFFTTGLPILVLMFARAVYLPLTHLVSRKGFYDGGLAEFYFNRFEIAMLIPCLLSIVGGVVTFLIWKKDRADSGYTMFRLLAVQTFVSMFSFLWFAAYIVAAVKGG